MQYICKYQSPLGGITVSADGNSLTGLWFDGQKYFAATLPAREAAPRIRPDTAVAGLLLQREKPGIYTPAAPQRVALPAGRMGNIAANTVRGNNHL